MFGRGGEEAAALKKAGIPFEIVPGITSAIGVPSYLGIPVTHRDMASSVHIVTAHKKDGACRISTTGPWLRGAARSCFLWE